MCPFLAVTTVLFLVDGTLRVVLPCSTERLRDLLDLRAVDLRLAGVPTVELGIGVECLTLVDTQTALTSSVLGPGIVPLPPWLLGLLL